MELKRVFQLLDAGYTKEQIEAYEQGLKDSKPEEKPEEKPIEKPDIKPEEKPDNIEQIINGLRGQIESLTNTIHEMNTRNETFKNDTQMTADKALADIWGKGDN